MLLSVVALVLSPAPAALRRVARVDDRATYAIKAIIDLGGQDDVRFTGTLKERVREVDADALTTEVDSQVSVDVLGVVRQGGTLNSKRVEKTDGTLVNPAKVESTLLFAVPRVDRLRAFYYPSAPVEIGSGWWRTEPRSDTFKAPPFASFLKIVGEEKIGTHDVWRASLDAQEADDAAPVHVRGMLFLDKADGSLVRGQWTVDGFILNASTPAMHARLELTRVETP